MALRIYSGEYLLAPFLLHFGGNWCTHNCQYCFANLNKPDRAADVNDIARMYQWYDRGSTCMEFELLQAGHPVLMSNDSDPCSKSNAALFAAVHDASRSLGFRMVYQTRGGEAQAEERIIGDKPTTVYVSLTTDNDETRAKYEPGAPTHSKRLAFIERLRGSGHHVIVGLNPFVPAWWDNLAATFERLRSWGVSHVWHQAMHMSHIQVASMKPAAKQRNAELIQYATRKVAPDAEDYAIGLRTIEGMGFNLFSGGVSHSLGFWDAHFACGHPFAPTMDALVRDASEQGGGAPVLLTLDEFSAWADIGIRKPRAVWKEFLNGFGRSARNIGLDAKAKTQAEVDAWMWRVEDLPTRLRHPAFARAEHDGGYAADQSGVPMLAVSREAFAGWTVPADDCIAIRGGVKRG